MQAAFLFGSPHVVLVLTCTIIDYKYNYSNCSYLIDKSTICQRFEITNDIMNWIDYVKIINTVLVLPMINKYYEYFDLITQ